jgi:hypothetical protein
MKEIKKRNRSIKTEAEAEAEAETETEQRGPMIRILLGIKRVD